MEQTPIVICLKNLTDNNIKNVKLFNSEFSSQNEIEYRSLKDMPYQELLNQMNDLMLINRGKYVFGLTVIQVQGEKYDIDDYKKQLECPINLIDLKLELSNNIIKTIKPKFANEQMSKTQCVCKETFELVDGVSLEIEYLLPQMQVYYYFYIAVIHNPNSK